MEYRRVMRNDTSSRSRSIIRRMAVDEQRSLSFGFIMVQEILGLSCEKSGNVGNIVGDEGIVLTSCARIKISENALGGFCRRSKA